MKRPEYSYGLLKAVGDINWDKGVCMWYVCLSLSYVCNSIEIQPRHVYWSESGNLVCLATDDSYYVLKYNAAVVTRAKETNTNITEDGIEDAFEVSVYF